MGGGKSVVCLAIAIILSKLYPNSKWCVIRESIPTLKRTTLETFKKLKPTNFIQSENQQDHTVTFKNGSQILFMAEDYINDKDFDRFKGLEVNGFILEQLEELNEGLLDVCFIRAGRWKIDKQPPALVIGNVNPTLLWPKTKIYDRYQNNTLPKDWYYLPARISDNPTLFDDKGYMERLTGLEELTYKRLIEGDWTAFAVKNPFFYSFKYEKHVVKEYKPNSHLPIVVSFDFNVSPMTACVGQQPDLMTAYVFDEFEIDNGSSEEICELVRAKYPKWDGNIDVTGDATGRNRTSVTRGNLNHYRVIKDNLGLTDANLIVPRQNPAVKDSRVLCNSVLQHANLYITENCKLTIADIVHASVDEFGDLVKSKDQGMHHTDNFRYICHAFFAEFIRHPERYQE